MKIRFIQCFATGREVFRDGETHDVGETLASECLHAGIAEQIDSKERGPFAHPPIESFNTPTARVRIPRGNKNEAGNRNAAK